MKQFIILWHCIPETIIIYRMETDDPDKVRRVESLHRKWLGDDDFTDEMTEDFSDLPGRLGAEQLLDDTDSEASIDPIMVAGDCTIIITGQIL